MLYIIGVKVISKAKSHIAPNGTVFGNVMEQRREESSSSPPLRPKVTLVGLVNGFRGQAVPSLYMFTMKVLPGPQGVFSRYRNNIIHGKHKENGKGPRVPHPTRP